MKKSIVALAALSLSGLASAQSSVTIYGRVEMGLTKQTTQPIRMDATNGTSRIGFTGVEDLGGGLKATFKLEHRLSAESGSSDGTTGGRPFWQGESTVGLAGAFGSVRLGRALTAYRNVDTAASPWGTERIASVAPATVKSETTAAADVATTDGGGVARTDAIHWVSNDYSGFKGAISLAPKGQANSVPAQ